MEKDWIDLEGFKGLKRIEKDGEDLEGKNLRKDGEGLEGWRRFGRKEKVWKDG